MIVLIVLIPDQGSHSAKRFSNSINFIVIDSTFLKVMLLFHRWKTVIDEPKIAIKKYKQGNVVHKDLASF